MAQSIDWLPHARLMILAMVQSWFTVLAEEVKDEKGQTVTKTALWGIPAAAVNTLMLAFDAARGALKTAMAEETRTKVTNKICKDTFKELTTQMRAMKRKYFTMPPLTGADYISLGFQLPDTNPNAAGAPTVQIAVTPYPTGAFGEVGVTFEAIRGDLRDKANKEIRLYYKIVGDGESIPQSPEDLTKSVTMRRKNESLKKLERFSGKKVYMAARAENGQLEGPWGPMVSAVIP